MIHLLPIYQVPKPNLENLLVGTWHVADTRQYAPRSGERILGEKFRLTFFSGGRCEQIIVRKAKGRWTLHSKEVWIRWQVEPVLGGNADSKYTIDAKQSVLRLKSNPKFVLKKDA